jgi:hypothetical protein
LHSVGHGKGPGRGRLAAAKRFGGAGRGALADCKSAIQQAAILRYEPNFVLVAKPFDAPPAEASLILQVDHSERRWRDRLPDGMSNDSRRVALAATA